MPTFNIQRTGVGEDSRNIKMLVCGEPGTGKTLTASTWPGVLLATAEGLLMSLDERGVPYLRIKSTDELRELIKVLRKPEVHMEEFGFEVKTIVIDTIDEIGHLFVRERLKEEKRKALRIDDYGWLKEQFKGLTRALRDLDMNVVMNCHLKSKSMNDVDYYLPALDGAFSEEIAGYVDLSVVLRTRLETAIVDGKSQRQIQRYMQTYPEPPQFEFIKDHSGKLPQEFPVNFEDDYERLSGYIFGHRKAKDSAEQVPADFTELDEEQPATDVPDDKVDEPGQPALAPDLSDEQILEEIGSS